MEIMLGRILGKNAKMLELFIQYVLEHTGWSIEDIALYQKIDHAKGETISWIERKPQVEISAEFTVEVISDNKR